MERFRCSVVNADLADAAHRDAVIALIDEYRSDPMGGPLPPMDRSHGPMLIDGLRNHPASFVLLARTGDARNVGLLVGFWGFSTFQLKSQLNIHDLVVLNGFRGRGIGKTLLLAAGDAAREKKCCRLTLEVRSDNAAAQRLYRSVGFDRCDPPMEYWHWRL